MSYLLDTNILSELRKPEPRRHAGLSRWFATTGEDEIYLSTLVLGEVHKGIARVRRSDPKQARALGAWLANVEKFYSDRVLPVTASIAARWGQVQSRRSWPVIDALMAATADEHGLQLVTRNTRDLAGWPAKRPILNPWLG